MNIKITDYKGHEIHYDSFTKQFSVEDKSFTTQTEAETYIERIVRAEKADFKRIPVIYEGYYSITCGEVTSIMEGDAWMVSSEGKRTKERIECLYHATPENLARVKRYQEINNQIAALQQERDGIKFDSPLSEGG